MHAALLHSTARGPAELPAEPPCRYTHLLLPPQGGPLQLLPAAAASGQSEAEGDSGYGGVFIGDVRLSELRQALAEAGIASEFHGGGLFCAGHVVVRRQVGLTPAATAQAVVELQGAQCVSRWPRQADSIPGG